MPDKLACDVPYLRVLVRSGNGFPTDEGTKNNRYAKGVIA